MDETLLQERHRSPYRFQEKAGRMLWKLIESTLFRWSWPTWYGYRAFLLRRFGARAHPTCRIRRTCTFECPWNLTIGANTATGEAVWFYCVGPIDIGCRVTLSHFCRLCAGSHDHSEVMRMPLLRPKIRIETDAWLATSAFVGPGVTVGEGAVLGACGVAMRDLSAWHIHAGNPAAMVRPRPRNDTPADGVSHDTPEQPAS